MEKNIQTVLVIFGRQEAFPSSAMINLDVSV